MTIFSRKSPEWPTLGRESALGFPEHPDFLSQSLTCPLPHELGRKLSDTLSILFIVVSAAPHV